MPMSNKYRNHFIDAIKAIAIILVVVGHSIQYGSGEGILNNRLFFDNCLFKFIYSFHMPLFMMVSGYLFYFSTAKHTLNHNIKTRIFSLLVPIAIWALPPFIYYIIENYQHITFGKFILSYLSYMTSSLWFLWAILFCSLIVLMVKYLFNDSLIIYFIGLIATFFVPDTIPAVLKFMLPYFLTGYWFNKYFEANIKNHFSTKKYFIGLSLSGVAFFILLIFYNRDSYIYTTGYYILKEPYYLFQIIIDIYRFFVGLLGSIFIILTVKLALTKLPKLLIMALSFIGKSSLWIYAISGYIFTYILPTITSQNLTINYAVVLVQTAVIIVLSIAIGVLITKIPILNRLLFGGR